jgi:hypothetical protein
MNKQMSEKLYTPQSVADIIGKSKQTIILWDKYSDQLERDGRERLIPRPLWINNGRFWTEEDLPLIEKFSKSICRGDLAEFNRLRWGKRSKISD